MAEVQARSQGPSSRGRGGGRGGRGGFSARSAPNRRTNGDKITIADATPDDDGDVSQLRKQYGEKLDTIKELFPNWSDADILYALKETDGDVEVTATRIADGTKQKLFHFHTILHLLLRPFCRALSPLPPCLTLLT